MYAIAALLVFAVVVSAQRPEPCTTPPQWEGRLVEVDPSKNFTVFGKLLYDAPNERVRLIEDVDVSGKKYFYDYIILYKEKKVYRIELSINGTGKCTVFPYTEPFRPAEIPSDAKFATEAYVGASSIPGVGVLVNIFYGQVERKGVKMDYLTTVTNEECIPVSSIVYSKQTGAIHSSFFDIVLGIPDPERFVPPRSCEQVSTPPGKIPMHF